MNEELYKASKEYQITHPAGENAHPDKERAKKAQEAFLAGSEWEFLSAEGEPVDKAHLENALNNPKQELQFFVREKGGEQNVYPMKMYPNEKKGSPVFSVFDKPVTSETLEQSYLPTRIKETKPQPLSRWQRFVSSARSFFRMKPSTAQTNYNKAMRTYKDELAKFRLNVGKPTIDDRGRMGIGIHGQTPAEAKPKTISQENLKKEMHVVDRFLRPQNMGYTMTNEQGRAICNDAKAFTPDWKPAELHDFRLAQDWEAYKSFATTIHNAAQKDSAVRNLVCSIGATRDMHQEATPDSGLRRLFTAYRSKFNNDKIMDLDAMLHDAVHGRTSDPKTHDLSNLLLDGRTPANRIKDSKLDNPVKAPEPLQMKH